MSDKQPSVYIKVAISPGEARELDDAVQSGKGTSRADLCRKAVILYLHDANKKERVEA